MGIAESVGMSTERLARIRPAIAKHVGEAKIAGAVTLVARRGKVVHQECVGLMDRESNKPMQADAIFRIYSMTKPIICVALMTLYEKGHFQLFDPVAKFIPAFRDLKVYAGGERSSLELVDLARPVTIRDLLTHTSGLTYHFFEHGPVEELYREACISSEKPLQEFVADLLALPLAFQPGTAYRYSYAHDVVAHLIELMSGQSADAYLRENVFGPLGMVDTGYHVPQDKLGRLTSMYGTFPLRQPNMTFTKWYADAANAGDRVLATSTDCLESGPHNVFRGGHGLVSTAQDYYRFAQMLLNNGELSGVRILGRKTVELMTSNHLHPDLLRSFAQEMYASGEGYGLGVGVTMDVAQSQAPGSVGTYGWGGAASTDFWIDPQEQLIGIQMAQFQPAGGHPMGASFRVAAYQAIVD
jgi:CubicO group peptidase (beta-lactamase class C family)